MFTDNARCWKGVGSAGKVSVNVEVMLNLDMALGC